MSLVYLIIFSMVGFSQAPTGEPVPAEAVANEVFEVPGVAMPMPQETVATDPLLEGFFEDIQYNPTDKRDPFLPYLVSPGIKMTTGAAPQVPTGPLEPLQKFALEQLKVVGIIWDVGRPKALIQDPAGKSHIILENTKLGQRSGYVAAIREGEIIVIEEIISQEGQKSFQTQILKLATNKRSL